MKTRIFHLLSEYNLSNYEPYSFGVNTGGKSNSLGSTRGGEFPIYTPLDEPSEDDEEYDSDEFDDFVNLSDIDSSMPRARVDLGSRRDNANFVTNGGGLRESPHTNTAVKGIATGLSYRAPSGKKNQGASITGRTSSYPMFNPGRSFPT